MMMNNPGKSILALLLAFIVLTLSNSAIAKVSAYLNQDTFYVGDPITLNIETDMNTNAKPDLSVLQKNFNVLGTGTSSQINILNGRRSFKKTWTVNLQPKSRGALDIPAIPVGNEKTQPLRIKIAAVPPEVKAETSRHVFIETSIGTQAGNNNEVYVQQQIPYMVKLYFDSAMQSGEISQPSVENAVVEELTDDKRYTVVRAGKKFNVVEKHFTISPEKSGKLHIPPTRVTGRITLENTNAQAQQGSNQGTNQGNNLNRFFGNDPFFNDPFFNNSFDSFFSRNARAPSKPFTVESKAIDVNVLPVPKSFTGSTWLPAEELNIRDSWMNAPPELKVGEPVTRTLVIRAKGLGGSQIPNLEIPKPDGVKIYPQQPENKTHTDGVTLIGRQYLDVTYIPQKEGKVTIPEIRVDWWNVKTKKQETVVVPAWQLNIAPGILQNTDENTAKDAESATSASAPKNETQKITDKAAGDQSGSATSLVSASWNWKIAALIALLLLFFGGLFYVLNRNRKKSLPPAKTLPPQSKNISALKTRVLQACDRNDKKAAAKALLELVQAQWNDKNISNLGFLSANLEKGGEIIRELQESLYSPTPYSWNGKRLKALVEAGLEPARDHSEKDSGVLEPLYPL